MSNSSRPRRPILNYRHEGQALIHHSGQMRRLRRPDTQSTISPKRRPPPSLQHIRLPRPIATLRRTTSPRNRRRHHRAPIPLLFPHRAPHLPQQLHLLSTPSAPTERPILSPAPARHSSPQRTRARARPPRQSRSPSPEGRL